MNFFPVNSTSVTATNVASAAAAIPTPIQKGGFIRLVRQNTSDRVFIAFGGASVAATTSSTELINGIVEIWQMPDAATYTYYSVITSANTVGVNISVSPRFE